MNVLAVVVALVLVGADGTRTLEASGTGTIAAASKADIAKYGGEKAQAEAEASAVRVAERQAEANVRKAALAQLIVELADNQRQIIATQSAGFARYGERLVLEALTVKNATVVEQRRNDSAREITVRVRFEVQTDVARSALELWASRLNPAGKPAILVVVQDVDASGGRPKTASSKALEEMATMALRETGFPLATSEDVLRIQAMTPTDFERWTKSKKEVATSIERAGAAAALVGTLTITKTSVMSNTGLPALDGQTRVEARLQLTAVSREGTVLDQDVRAMNEIGISLERALARAARGKSGTPIDPRLLESLAKTK